MTNTLITVTKKDEPLGEVGKLEAHLGDGTLHRAYTAILINDQKQILITQRSLKKPLWPTFWDGSFSSHPEVGESLEQSAVKRAMFELGIETSGYNDLFSYYYQAKWNEFFSEHEVNHILVGHYTGKIKPNSEEVLDYKWVRFEEMVEWVQSQPEIMAPWWMIAVDRLMKSESFNAGKYE